MSFPHSILHVGELEMLRVHARRFDPVCGLELLSTSLSSKGQMSRYVVVERVGVLLPLFSRHCEPR